MEKCRSILKKFLILRLENSEKSMIYCFELVHIIINNLCYGVKKKKKYNSNNMNWEYAYYCNMGVVGKKPDRIILPLFFSVPLDWNVLRAPLYVCGIVSVLNSNSSTRLWFMRLRYSCRSSFTISTRFQIRFQKCS